MNTTWNAGMDHEVFSDEASEAIYRYTGGSAGLVNKACTSTLIFRYQSGKRIIDDNMVKLVSKHHLVKDHGMLRNLDGV